MSPCARSSLRNGWRSPSRTARRDGSRKLRTADATARQVVLRHGRGRPPLVLQGHKEHQTGLSRECFVCCDHQCNADVYYTSKDSFHLDGKRICAFDREREDRERMKYWRAIDVMTQNPLARNKDVLTAVKRQIRYTMRKESAGPVCVVTNVDDIRKSHKGPG